MEYNNNGDSNITASKVDGALKELDKAVASKQTVLKGNAGQVPVFGADSTISGCASLNGFELKGHKHDEYMTKVPNAVDGNVSVWKSGSTSDSGVSFSSFVSRDSFDFVKTTMSNQATQIQDITKKLDNLSPIGHNHADYYRKSSIVIDDGKMIVSKGTELADAGFNASDVALKADVMVLINDLKDKIKTLFDAVGGKAEKQHSHSISDINTSELEAKVQTVIDNSVDDIHSEIISRIKSKLS